jgi:flagellar basal-body rod protein FlgB
VIFDTTQFALERAIEGASARHTALAGNLANANTPGYQRVDVDFHGALAAALSEQTGSARREAVQRAGFSTAASGGAVRADGGTVDVDAESAKVAANALEQQAAVSVARARIDILGAAMGVR